MGSRRAARYKGRQTARQSHQDADSKAQGREALSASERGGVGQGDGRMAPRVMRGGPEDRFRGTLGQEELKHQFTPVDKGTGSDYRRDETTLSRALTNLPLAGIIAIIPATIPILIASPSCGVWKPSELRHLFMVSGYSL